MLVPRSILAPAAESESCTPVNALGARPGSLGAVKVSKFPVYADESLRGASGMSTGANEDGYHLRNISIDRDIQVKTWADLRTTACSADSPLIAFLLDRKPTQPEDSCLRTPLHQ